MKFLDIVLRLFAAYTKDNSAKNYTYYDLGRNSKCHCDSGKKYKQCHLVADEKRSRVAILEVDQDGNKKVKYFKKGKVKVNVQSTFSETEVALGSK